MGHRGAEGAEEGGSKLREAALNRVSWEVIGAAMEVHSALGPGFLESVYERALCIELEGRGLAHERQVPIGVFYKGSAVGEARVDLLVGGTLLVEIKATDRLPPIHLAQVLYYLKACNLPLGLLINFNVESLRFGIRRVVNCPGAFAAEAQRTQRMGG